MGQEMLEVYCCGLQDVYIGPEDKVNLMEAILNVINQAIESDCRNDFSNLKNGLTPLLSEGEIEEVINILRSYGALCDCTIGEAMEDNYCIKDLVDLVNKIDGVKGNA